MVLTVSVALAMPLAGTASAQPAPRERAVAGCRVFPADNWWNADVSRLPVHTRSR